MKKMVSLGAVLFATLALTVSFVACSDDDEEEVVKTEIAVSAMKPGMTVTYDGGEYLVTNNPFYDESASRAILAAEQSDAVIAKNLEYISTYLDSKHRAKFLKEKAEMADTEEYLEIFLKTQRKETDKKGIASLRDRYVCLDEDGNKIAEIQQKWDSSSGSTLFQAIKGQDTWQGLTQDERTAIFNDYKEDALRLYDPYRIEVLIPAKNGALPVDYEYAYQYDENIEIIDDVDQLYHDQVNLYMEVASGVYKSYLTDKYRPFDGSHHYTLKDPVNPTSAINIQQAKDNKKFFLSAIGDGTIGGSTEAKVHWNSINDNNSNDYSFVVRQRFGENKTAICRVKGVYEENGVFPASFTIQTSTDGKTWADKEKNIALKDLSSKCDFIEFAEETTEVDAGGTNVTVPASITYRAHFAQKADGSYPTYDKYASITCYPTYDETNKKVYYELTEKSIEDYINAYKNDFAALWQSAQ